MIHRLEADSIQLEYDKRKILTDVYIKSETSTITGLLGRNGEGKSSLLKIIYGSMPFEKSVRINGIPFQELYRYPELLVFMPQFSFLPASRTVSSILRDFNLDASLFQDQFNSLFPDLGSKIKDLPGGGRRMLELYVIIKSDSKFALLDEPFTHLSPVQIEAAKQLLQEEKRRKGFIITDHMYQHVLDISNEIYLLSDGSIKKVSSLEEIARLGYINL